MTGGYHVVKDLIILLYPQVGSIILEKLTPWTCFFQCLQQNLKIRRPIFLVNMITIYFGYMGLIICVFRQRINEKYMLVLNILQGHTDFVER